MELLVLFFRFYYMSVAVHMFLGITPNDILYDALPLYHTAGGIVGLGQGLLKGVTIVIKKKFSASKFWEDCVHYKCTVSKTCDLLNGSLFAIVQYIPYFRYRDNSVHFHECSPF